MRSAGTRAPMTPLGVRLFALGLSATVHAAAVFTAVGHPAVAQSTSDVVGIEGLTVLEPRLDVPEPVANVSPATGRATKWPMHVHSYPVPSSHDWTPHDPNLVHVFSPPVLKPIASPPPSVAPPRPVETASDEAPRFTIAMSALGGDAHGEVAFVGSGSLYPDDAPVPEGSVDAPARLVRGLAPAYPPAARADGVEGDVQIELVVGVSGAVESARVVGASGHGFDEAALAAARQFRFFPATIAGKPVRVRMGWSIEFRLR